MANGPNWIDIQAEVLVWQCIKLQAGSLYWYTTLLLSLLSKSFLETVDLAFPTFLWPYSWPELVQHPLIICVMGMSGLSAGAESIEANPQSCLEAITLAIRWMMVKIVPSLAVVWDALEVNSEVNICPSNLCNLLGYPAQSLPLAKFIPALLTNLQYWARKSFFHHILQTPS